ncbi:semaphorin-4A [Pygocentrus nattereri]|uniref:semaphorin-4A n=1 Tax=Pygocentrus nattereri TaxID=42514 RepID=UPI000814731E|nr:semaphorin-4A [Pygocentrus nattereri]
MAGVHQVWKIFTLLGYLHVCQSSNTPRTSFFLGSPGRVLSTYKTSDVQNTTALLLSPDAATLFVGVKNAVLSLDVSQPHVITPKNKYDWTPKHGFRCQTSEKNCANFVRILQFINSTHLYACGSFAFKPEDIILTADSLSVSRAAQSAKGVCPYKGSERNTAVFVDGELYTTTTEDYFGSTPVISRHFSKGRNNLNLDTTFKKLSDPTFISSSYIPSEGKVLFFFREEAAEYSYTERFFVSRVAQVCTDDNGGERVLQKSWTTFAKSQLICQTEKQLPFNLLQDIVMMPPADDELPDNTRFYGIFTSQWALGSSPTAVCAFTLGSIKAAFSGAYKTYTAETYQREQPNPNSKLGKCGIHNDTDSTLNLVKKTFLTATSVKSEGNKQLLITNEVLYSRITAQTVQAASGHIYTVLYLLTETGLLHKVVLQNNGFHIIEEIQVFKQPQTVKSILLSVTKGVVFVGSSEGVIRVPVSNCSFYSSCAECVLARDPFCGWDLLGKACIPVSDMKPDLNVSIRQDIENGNAEEQCKNLTDRSSALVRKVVSVQLYRLVMLPCYSSSRQAKVSWRFPNHSTLPQSLYLQHEDGSLIFFVTPSTALEYFCVTEEQGFQQTAAISLKLQTSSRSQTSSSCSGLEPIPVPDLYEDTIMHQKIYYNELVAVSSLLAICLFVIAVGALLWWRKSHNTDPADPECLPAHDVGLSLHLK